jgi:hypothetical protein
MAGSLLAMLISSTPAIVLRAGYNKDIAELNDNQSEIYKQFMDCEEFSDSFKAEFTKIADDYTNGMINYDEFEKKVEHLNSVKYSQEVLNNSTTSEFKAQILGIVIVLGLFAAISTSAKALFNNTWLQINTLASSKIVEVTKAS